ncbi:hypothetical protein HS088_TW06G00709 [Tripterygium wilfordii]|uniref:Uncharacterized protein n=1 Tax=Tripterygium wilfordii TaxID=458696 RepID=A0A7J7DJQ1_TRIWF|nr:hypothetical protein HS088_TW06G00709 [Tripterygium wilfordii]
MKTEYGIACYLGRKDLSSPLMDLFCEAVDGIPENELFLCWSSCYQGCCYQVALPTVIDDRHSDQICLNDTNTRGVAMEVQKVTNLKGTIYTMPSDPGSILRGLQNSKLVKGIH